MQVFDLKTERERLGLTRLELARLIGYTGTDRNDEMRVRRYEGGTQVPLYIARLVYMIRRFREVNNLLPNFPAWKGYDFDHVPDHGHHRREKPHVGP